MVSKVVQVHNAEGIQLRPAGILCEAAYRFQSAVRIRFEDKEIDAKSVLSVLSAGIGPGDTIAVICEGKDEQLALDSMVKVIEEL